MYSVLEAARANLSDRDQELEAARANLSDRDEQFEAASKILQKKKMKQKLIDHGIELSSSDDTQSPKPGPSGVGPCANTNIDTDS